MNFVVDRGDIVPDKGSGFEIYGKILGKKEMDPYGSVSLIKDWGYSCQVIQK